MTVRFVPSPNFNERVGGMAPAYVVLHYTGTQTSQEAFRRFCDPAPTDSYGRLSCHYMIDEHAEIIQFVNESERAWHAGKSYWRGIKDMNSASIGIEIWNRGHIGGDQGICEDFTQNQIYALIDLLQDIISRHNISPDAILGHSDIAPGRKIDPGEKFPWEKLAHSGIGIMPNLMKFSHFSSQGQALQARPDLFFECLHHFGYDPAVKSAQLLREFRRHYAPHLMDQIDLDIETCTSLISIMKQSEIEIL